MDRKKQKHSLGRKARTKQSDPVPLQGSTHHPHTNPHIGKKKAGLEAKAIRDGNTGRATPGKKDKKVKEAKSKKPAAKMSNGASKKRARNEDGDSDDDDLEGLQAEDDEEFSEEEDDQVDRGLEAARSALFDAADLEEPTLESDEEEEEVDTDREDDESDDDGSEVMDDEFDLEALEAMEGDGVTLDDFEMTAEEAEMMPASGKKAARRAAKLAAAFDSDIEEEEETDEPVLFDKPIRMPVKAAAAPTEDEDNLEGSSDDEDDETDEIQEGQLDDLRAVERRMRSSARVLGNWKELGASTGKSRSDLITQLISDVCQYHGYTPYLAEKLFDLFGVDEALQFFTTSDTPRPLTLRVNTLKTRRRDLAQALINRGVNLEPLEGGWSKVGLQVFSGGGVPVGATPEYLAGHYILQSASSFLPVIALGPKPHERVLDMSAAPGGKTTYMSALMGNTGEVWANDSSRGRIKGLGGNIARLGCRNVIITNVDGRDFPKTMGGFDRVLLDAPCSGTGVISKDQSVKVNKTERDFTLLSHLQKQLVLCAIDSVTPNSSTGGFVVYSTCSVTTEENESVVSYALRKRPHVKLVDTGLQFGKEGFKSFRGKDFGKNMHLTRRFYPHVHNMDGFFVAKFKVGKPEKKVAQDDDFAEPYQPLTEDEDVSDDEPAATFNDDEDEAIIAASKKRYLKSKGVNVKATKASVEAKKGEGEPVAKKAKK